MGAATPNPGSSGLPHALEEEPDKKIDLGQSN